LPNDYKNIDLAQENIFKRCLNLIKNFYIEKSKEILCKEEDSNYFFINYQKKCEIENDSKIDIIDPLKSQDFITSMASVHRNSIASKDLFSILNGKKY